MSKLFDVERVRRSIQGIESGKDVRKPDPEKGGGGPGARGGVETWHASEKEVDRLLEKLSRQEAKIRERAGELAASSGSGHFRGEFSGEKDSMSRGRIPLDKSRFKNDDKRITYERGLKRSDRYKNKRSKMF